MKSTTILICFVSLFFTNKIQSQDTTTDSLRNIEINKMWIEISRSVKEGDFIGYKSTCHEKGVFISTTGKNKISIPLSAQLKKWEKNFTNAKDGLTIESVDFRFKQKVSDPSTAHYIGMFYYTLQKKGESKVAEYYTHFEALLIKENEWQIMMEYQKSNGGKSEWDALNPSK